MLISRVSMPGVSVPTARSTTRPGATVAESHTWEFRSRSITSRDSTNSSATRGHCSTFISIIVAFCGTALPATPSCPLAGKPRGMSKPDRALPRQLGPDAQAHVGWAVASKDARRPPLQGPCRSLVPADHPGPWILGHPRAVDVTLPTSSVPRGTPTRLPRFTGRWRRHVAHCPICCTCWPFRPRITERASIIAR